MSKKQKSNLKISNEKLKKSITFTNKKIVELGDKSEELHKKITTIRESFENISNTPEEKNAKLKKIKKIYGEWHSRAEEIEKEANKIEEKLGKGVGGGTVFLGIGAFGPKAAMGFVKTYCNASTGTAIADLSGAVATKAALAWLGGGTIASGGGGMVAGKIFLAFLGSTGWMLGGAFVVYGVINFIKAERERKRLEEIIISINNRDRHVYKTARNEIEVHKQKADKLIIQLDKAIEEIATFGNDYSLMTEEQQYKLGSYVNITETAVTYLETPVKALQPKYTEEDYKNFANSEFIELPYGNKKNTIISLANLFYGITLSEDDQKIMFNALKNNKAFLKSIDMRTGKLDIKKEKFNVKIINRACDALRHKRELIRKKITKITNLSRDTLRGLYGKRI